MRMANLDRVIKEAGGAAPVAAKLGVSIQRLWNWTERGVPIEHCRALVDAVEHRVEVWDLRPADWRRIWPELAAAEGAPSAPERAA